MYAPPSLVLCRVAPLVIAPFPSRVALGPLWLPPVFEAKVSGRKPKAGAIGTGVAHGVELGGCLSLNRGAVMAA